MRRGILPDNPRRGRQPSTARNGHGEGSRLVRPDDDGGFDPDTGGETADGLPDLRRHGRDVHGRRRRGRAGALHVAKALDRPRARLPEHRGRARAGRARPRPHRRRSCSRARTVFTYGTTRATNAIVEGRTARTAFFTTEGFPDMLLLREGGKLDPFRQIPYPPPYVPRFLTFEIRERIDSEGDVFVELDEASVRRRDRARRGGSAPRRSPSACSGRSSTRRTSCASASCSSASGPESRSRSRIGSTRSSASTGARRRLRSTPR